MLIGDEMRFDTKRPGIVLERFSIADIPPSNRYKRERQKPRNAVSQSWMIVGDNALPGLMTTTTHK